MAEDVENQIALQRVERPGEGQAVCFDLKSTIRLSTGTIVEITEQGFLACYQGQLRAWRNHCPHAGSPLDWNPGQFFSDDGTQLVCHTHGALFDPLSGDCLAGPCPRGLFPIELREEGCSVLVPESAPGVEA
ncbi:Rieske [2Fe-2S] domain protein [Mariprofundus micogutta]|uniref:Rieske [2Fe-2S] domain protein n=1 Tax=Mariprofundus micogutta TaxID=1921010 RepID=A0A1L8CNG8_9PROT|nr:Rieske 2Fe-2S domain-containing protein [Mariprofundus micogutta]GAV20447.1 Rieske [2Fe-2S] domain protein [Mariprofundus micogutta]